VLRAPAIAENIKTALAVTAEHGIGCRAAMFARGHDRI